MKILRGPLPIAAMLGIAILTMLSLVKMATLPGVEFSVQLMDVNVWLSGNFLSRETMVAERRWYEITLSTYVIIGGVYALLNRLSRRPQSLPFGTVARGAFATASSSTISGLIIMVVIFTMEFEPGDPAVVSSFLWAAFYAGFTSSVYIFVSFFASLVLGAIGSGIVEALLYPITR